MYFFQNEFYKNGYMIKEVAVNSYITAEDVRATVEEMQLFREKKAKANEDYDDFDGTKSDISSAQTLMDDLLDLQADGGEETYRIPFIPGDMVQVLSGELRNLVGKVKSVDEATQVTRTQATSNKPAPHM